MFHGRGLVYVSTLPALVTLLKWVSLKPVMLVVIKFPKGLNYHKI